MAKHGIPASLNARCVLPDIVSSLDTASAEAVLSLLCEIVSTQGDLRARVDPKYRFKERFSDLSACLRLDGYIVDYQTLTPIDPSIDDGEPMEDDLLAALRNSGISNWEEIAKKINDSSNSFRATAPNYNASLNDIRVSLETLGLAIAHRLKPSAGQTYDKNKWGSALTYMRQLGFISEQEEKGLAGVYGFISPGSHRPVGISEEQMARLGRSFALGMSWFLLKTYQSAM